MGLKARVIPLQSAFPIAFLCRQEVHEVASGLPVFLALESHVEVRGRPEHVEERPQCKALAPILLKAKVDPAMLDPGCQSVGCNLRQIGRGKVAKDKIIELHY